MNEEELLSIFRCHANELFQKYQLSDSLLLCFLRTRKFNVERALTCLKKYLKMIENNPELLEKQTYFGLDKHLNQKIQIAYKAKNNSRSIFVFRAGRWDPSISTLDDIFRCNIFFLQRIVSDRDAQINGVEAVFDLANFPFSHARYLTPSYAKQIADILTGAFPVAFKGIHIVNQNWILSLLMAMIMPFLSAKIQNRIHQHGMVWESLHRYISPDDLPVEYGGRMESLDCSRWTKFSSIVNRESIFDFVG